jgi:predicted LPLAT superfamily acyltransferase
VPDNAARSATHAASGTSEWATRTERGSFWLMRLMSWLSIRLGRRATRIILYGAAGYFFLFAPTVRRHARDYLRRALGRSPTALDRFRHLLVFASTIHDRVLFLHGRFADFHVSIQGEDLLRATFARGQGALLMGAHFGSFEVLRATGHQQPGLEVAMAMYADNARKINAVLAAVNPLFVPGIIELGHVSAMLDIRARLERGAFVGMLADRSPGDEPTEQVPFLGAPAAFPVGPMRAAAMLRRPVYFIAGVYLGGNRYQVIFEQIADFATAATGERDAAISAGIRRYAAALERGCRSHPYNWFNFFDFWKPPAAAKHFPTGRR